TKTNISEEASFRQINQAHHMRTIGLNFFWRFPSHTTNERRDLETERPQHRSKQSVHFEAITAAILPHNLRLHRCYVEQHRITAKHGQVFKRHRQRMRKMKRFQSLQRRGAGTLITNTFE